MPLTTQKHSDGVLKRFAQPIGKCADRSGFQAKHFARQRHQFVGVKAR
jgi:hypothetical protein